jgi:hypothetical protein
MQAAGATAWRPRGSENLAINRAGAGAQRLQSAMIAGSGDTASELREGPSDD